MGTLKRGPGLGRAKLLLFGEHAAVYGHPAVGLSLPEATRAELTIDGSGRWRFPDSSSAEAETLEKLLRSFEALVPGLGASPGGELRLASDIPPGLGFGSSAALCAAVASAFRAALSRPDGRAASEEMRAIWAWAHEAERLFHGTPSGIDTGLALLDGLYRFAPDPPGLPAYRPLRGRPLSLVVGAVPRSTDGGSLIRTLRKRMSAGDRRTAGILCSLGEIAGRAADFLDGSPSPLAELGSLASQAHELLARLGLSTPELDGLIREGARAGALGGKMSGAGGGGAFFLLAADPDGAEALAERLRGQAPTIRTVRWNCREETGWPRLP